MERRIKIVWLLSLLSALVIIGAQGYWLYSQYRYVADSYIQEIITHIQAAGDEEYEIRKTEKGGSFSYSMVRETAYDDMDDKTKQMTTMMFSSGKTELGKEDPDRKTVLDSIIKKVKKRAMKEQVDYGSINIDLIDSAKIKPLSNNEIRDTSSLSYHPFSLSFDPKLPEDSIIWGMNRAMVNYKNPFREELLDSILRQNMPDLSFTILPLETTDDVMPKSTWTNTGGFLSPRILYTYAYSPFQREGVCLEVTFLTLPVFRKMAAQLVLAFGLVLLLIGCLIFQIKTILKQRKIGEMRQQFVNTMIHELKRPVQTLKTFVAFLGDKNMRSDEPMTEQVVQDSMFELDNLSAYLNKLKDMVRADDEDTPLHVSPFNLHELTDKVIRLTHIPAGKEVEFATQFEMESPRIEADPIHVANVLSNLIENAIKYSGEKVKITIHIQRKANELWLTVSDNGIGIPLVEQDKVFAKFYRGSNMPDMSIPGLGLGLSYVKLISEAHHGSVSLNSRPGEGTSITLYLPQ